MIKAKLFVCGTERELLWTDLEYHRVLSYKTGRPGSIPMGGLASFSFISGYDDDSLLRWMTHSQKDERCTLTACKIVFYKGDFDGVVLFEYTYNDAALVYWKETFNSIGDEPMTITMTISAAVQEVKGVPWVKPWQESWVPLGGKFAGITGSKNTYIKKPEIQNGFWSNPRTGDGLKEATYGEKVKFTVVTKDIDDDVVLHFILYDYDGNYNPDDELCRSFSARLKNNIAELEFTPDIKWEESARFETDKAVETYFKIETEIEGRKITVQLPKKEDEYLKIYGTPEIITVLIELPHTGYTDKLNAKGLAGHSAIMIGTEFYDFGPQPGEPFLSDGRPWWDTMSKNENLKRADIMAILGNVKERKNWNIVGEVYLIDIEISPKEKTEIEKWWIKKYANPGNYSIIPLFGKQCTTNVVHSLSECTDAFNNFSIIPLIVQTPKELLHLLTTSTKHTYGKNRKKQLSITKKYNQI